MSVIKSNELTDIMIVVVRYFGGTLLGVQGLIQAYRKASESAIAHSTIIRKRIMERYELEFPYERIGEMEHLFKRHDVEVLSRMQRDSCTFVVDVPKEQASFFLETIRNGHPFAMDCKIKAC
jgi:putative IMPACT (imprinted ancient) family translation regulator